MQNGFSFRLWFDAVNENVRNGSLPLRYELFPVCYMPDAVEERCKQVIADVQDEESHRCVAGVERAYAPFCFEPIECFPEVCRKTG